MARTAVLRKNNKPSYPLHHFSPHLPPTPSLSSYLLLFGFSHSAQSVYLSSSCLYLLFSSVKSLVPRPNGFMYSLPHGHWTLTLKGMINLHLPACIPRFSSLSSSRLSISMLWAPHHHWKYYLEICTKHRSFVLSQTFGVRNLEGKVRRVLPSQFSHEILADSKVGEPLAQGYFASCHRLDFYFPPRT